MLSFFLLALYGKIFVVFKASLEGNIDSFIFVVQEPALEFLHYLGFLFNRLFRVIFLDFAFFINWGSFLLSLLLTLDQTHGECD